MKPQRLVLGGLGLWLGAAQLPAQFVWTGMGASRAITLGANWQGLTAPPNDGTADLQLGKAINRQLVLPAAFSLRSLLLSGGDEYVIDAASPTTLTLAQGISATDENYGRLWFTSNLTLNLSGAQTLAAHSRQVIVSGQITGSGPLTLLGSTLGWNMNGGGHFNFNQTGAGNTYTGGTTLGNGTDYVSVAFSNSAPFGTGAVSVLSGTAFGVQLIAHGTQTVANAFTFAGPGSIMLQSWDAPLTFSGAVTLASATTLVPGSSPKALAVANQANGFPVPGPGSRQPIVFSGSLGESGGARALTVGANNSGVLVLTGTNTYTGGTFADGSLVFGSPSAIPTGTVNVRANPTGYVGDATPGTFAAFLAHLDPASDGAVGGDTLPGSATATFSDAINLSGFTSPNLRLGTATSAILTGTVTPPGTSGYQFGNGGGTLYVQSSLALPRSLFLGSSNPYQPLTVYLQGTNSYTGATLVSNGLLILDGPGALSGSTSSLTAGGSSLYVGGSYLGYTDATTSLTSAAAFLAKFAAPASTWGILGFDTHAGNSTVTVNGLNLTGFNDGVFLGTATSASLNGTLVPSTVTNSSNAANTLRFTAALNGLLTVNSALSGSVAVLLGSPPYSGVYSSGTVVLNANNTYTGGTTLHAQSDAGLTLGLGNNSALGSGTLTVLGNSGGRAGLQATSGGINLPNPITLVNSTVNNNPTGTSGPQLHLTGTNAFTLSGNLTGDATTALTLFNAAPLTVSLAGDNSGFLGALTVLNGTLNLLSNTAAGLGYLDFGSAGAGTVTFGGNAAAPVVYGIKGDDRGSSQLIVPGGTNLTFNISADHNTDFGGTVSGSGRLTVTAPAATATANPVLYLYGTNTYTGGTVVQDRAVLALGSNAGAGTGAVTLNAPTGGLALNVGVTFANPLTYTAGALGGFGTFAPAGTTNLVVGTGQSVAPGIGFFAQKDQGVVGTLTLASDVTFANGGTYDWGLQDPTRADGLSLLNISGNLLITASAGGFNLRIATYDAANLLGLASLTANTPYSLRILHATGSITGFTPAAFTIDSTLFQSGLASATVFTLSQSGSDLYLNFTPIPEPSTYGLLGLGLGALALRLRRRRRV